MVSPSGEGREARAQLLFTKVFLLRASLVAQMVKNLSALQETRAQSLSWEDPLENGYPLQYSTLKNSMDREAWWTTVHGVPKSGT